METEQKIKKGIAFAILAAVLYAINAPFSKILLEFMPPTLMAGFSLCWCRNRNDIYCFYAENKEI